MEVESGCWKVRPSPYLVYIGGKDSEKMAFYSIGQIGDPKYVIKTKPPELRGKQIRASCYGWLILRDKQNNHYSLWNPLTLEFICLPALVLKPEQVISSRILSFPPGNHDSMLILFEKNVPLFIFCRIGDEKWTHQPITENFKHVEGDFLTNFVVCNGTLYCNTFRFSKLVKIDLSMQDNHYLALVLLDVSIPELLESYY
ncbi:hypothetical protein SLEP1_g42006 [Rubroshorea leprosula]|uniref:KIB1-4 beta-propeller domain-containing protein n=1 Tax=Rubroshorea leprosula TaxID=152421 RepID=A0AAV5L8E3_9ROSI|nr:hypothetical protein SLEP1_g42006 [Rubroshorea leprosula]